MGIVMISCPETRRAISTGIQVDRATFHSTPVFFSRTFCPLCRVKHEWVAKDAWSAILRPRIAARVARAKSPSRHRSRGALNITSPARSSRPDSSGRHGRSSA